MIKCTVSANKSLTKGREHEFWPSLSFLHFRVTHFNHRIKNYFSCKTTIGLDSKKKKKRHSTSISPATFFKKQINTPAGFKTRTNSCIPMIPIVTGIFQTLGLTLRMVFPSRGVTVLAARIQNGTALYLLQYILDLCSLVLIKKETPNEHK